MPHSVTAAQLTLDQLAQVRILVRQPVPSYRHRGRVVMRWSAKPVTPVRIRSVSPSFWFCNHDIGDLVFILRKMFHAAVTIFHPHQKSQCEYLEQLARIRLRNFIKQQSVTELTIITSVSPKMSSFVDQIIRQPYSRFDKVDIYVLTGKAHIGSGYLQAFVEPEVDWVYFDEDGHCLPIRADAVKNWYTETVDLLQRSDFDFLVEATKLLDEPIFKKEHKTAYRKWLMNSSPTPTLPTHEWGMYQKADTIRKYYRPPQWQRTQDGTFFLHQGAKVAYNNLRCRWFVHHGLSVGPKGFQLFDPAELSYACLELEKPEVPKWMFAKRFEQQLIENILQHTPITRYSFKKGQSMKTTSNYLPDLCRRSSIG